MWLGGFVTVDSEWVLFLSVVDDAGPTAAGIPTAVVARKHEDANDNYQSNDNNGNDGSSAYSSWAYYLRLIFRRRLR